MLGSEQVVAKCKVLRGTHSILGAGTNREGKERRFVLLEFHEQPDEGDWEWGDEVLVKRVSTKGRK